ncbi:nitrite reductase small subunit NirD [Streptomyces sp. ACA25]|nr:nitrite reductase small subunit NirD [Streptomyces sp. ACA25]MDB1088266.1 nitrite reductase small subunit NirD [Streptomyces sp. ACA25]
MTQAPDRTAPEPSAPTAPHSSATVTGTASRVQIRAGGQWVAVCGADDLIPGRGVAVVLPDGSQAAVFRDRGGRTYAVGNRDPFTGAYVLSRGLLGSAGETLFVASPLLKQRFDLTTGQCLDDPEKAVPVHPCRTV